MDNKVVFQVFKNIIIEQNKVFLTDLAKKFKRDPEDLCKKYIKPEYYLPVVTK